MTTKALHELVIGAFVTSIASVVGYALAFFFKVLAARYLGPYDFGIFTLSQTLLGISMVIASAGILEGIKRYIPHYRSRKSYSLLAGYLRFIFSAPLLASIVLGVIIFFGAPAFTRILGFDPILIVTLRITAFILPFWVIADALRKIFTATKQIIHSQVSYNFIEKGALLLGILIVMLTGAGVVQLVIASGIAIFLAFIYGIVIYPRINVLPVGATVVHEYRWREWFLFSWPLLFTSIFASLLNWTDNLVIGTLMSEEMLGVYATAFSFAVFLTFFETAFSSLFLPLISEKHDDETIANLYSKSAAWTFGATLPVYLLMLLYSKHVLSIFYGIEYAQGNLALAIVATGVLVSVTTGMSVHILVSHGKTRFLFFIQTAMACANLALTIPFVKMWGIEGAAIASASSMVLLKIIMLIKARSIQRIRFEGRYYGRFLLAGIIALFLSRQVLLLKLNVNVELVMAFVLYCLLYAVIVIVLRTFTKAEYDILLEFEKRAKINLGWLKRIAKKIYS